MNKQMTYVYLLDMFITSEKTVQLYFILIEV